MLPFYFQQTRICFIIENCALQIMNVFKYRNLFLLFVLVLQAQSLYFPLSSRPYCISIDDEPGKQFKFSYEISGNNPEAVKVDFQPEDSIIRPYSLDGARNQTSFENTNMKICFLSLDGTYKSVSIDFYTHDTSHLRQLAKKSQIYDLHSKLIEVGEKIKDINKNEVFEEEKQTIHSDIIVNHQWRIQFFAVVKLIAIVVVAGTQIYLLKKILSKGDKGYQPV